MFAKLFATGGLSLDRLKVLVEVGASGGIVKAAGGDPVRQSQYSRQIKELEDFFQVQLVERLGKGVRLTPSGKELARISRFFLLGLSNFQRGCLAEEQTYRIGAGATFIQQFLLPVVAEPAVGESRVRYAVEIATDEEIERRLHDLTLDFGVICNATISRPLQIQEIGEWRLTLWAPKAMRKSERLAVEAFKAKQLPLAWPGSELPSESLAWLGNYEPHLTCSSFLEARAAMEGQSLAVLLPGFLNPGAHAKHYNRVRIPALASKTFAYRFAWNPRLLRLNSHATRRKNYLIKALSNAMKTKNMVG